MEKLAKETLRQLREYTRDVGKFLNIEDEGDGKNHNGPFKPGKPCGCIIHYTASNAAISPKRPYGRYPVLRQRFQRGSRARVGVHFIVWDKIIPRFKEFQNQYPLLAGMPSEVAFMGDDLAFWHAGSANNWAYGIEIRNIGELERHGFDFRWGGLNYHGQQPVGIGDSFWEPYSRSQMEAVIWINRLMAAVHPIKPHLFLGHTNITASRVDPGPHFPIHDVREYSLFQPDVPLSKIPFLNSFSDDDNLEKRVDTFIEEEYLQSGKYRHDWDGSNSGFDVDTVPKPIVGLPKATLDNFKDMLSSVGYYVSDGTLPETLRILKSRWKRTNGEHTSEVDKETLRLLSVMVRQWDRLG